MKVAISCSPAIDNEHWIEKEIYDCLFEMDSPNKIMLPSSPDSNYKYLKKFFEKKHYDVTLFDDCWREHGIQSISKRNLIMISHADFVLALWDGYSRGTKNSRLLE